MPLIKAEEPSVEAKKLVDSLSYYFEHFEVKQRKIIVEKWKTIVEKKAIVIPYLQQFKGNQESSDWYWVDLKAKPFLIRDYINVTKEIGAMFLISAINYEDIAFAYNRVLYNNSKVDTSLIFEPAGIKSFNNARRNIDIDSMWDAVDIWKNNNYNGDLYVSDICWIGDSKGKITRKIASGLVIF